MTSSDLQSQIQEALSKVSDPELHRPITDLGMVSGVEVENGSVKLRILLTISGCPMRDRLESDITKAVNVLRELQIESQVRKAALDYAQKAKNSLASYSGSAKLEMIDLLDFVVTRSL